MLFEVALRNANTAYLQLATCLADGEEAILYLSGEGKYSDRSKYPFPDLLVLDLKMPGRSGFDVLEWMRQRGLSVFTIVHSDSSQQRDVERARELGAHEYQRKSGDISAISEWLRLVDQAWGAGRLKAEHSGGLERPAGADSASGAGQPPAANG